MWASGLEKRVDRGGAEARSAAFGVARGLFDALVDELDDPAADADAWST